MRKLIYFNCLFTVEIRLPTFSKRLLFKMTSVCQICDYNINASTHKSVQCQYCDFIACRTCCETYILNDTIPKCMNTQCNREWTRHFLRANFTMVFINKKFKAHREQILYERQRSMLPATQPFVEIIIRRAALKKEISEMESNIDNLKLKIAEKKTELYRVHDKQASSNSSVEIVRSCPDVNCRGYLNKQWKCGICEKWSCAQCHQIKGDTRDCEHTCNPDNLATVAMLEQNTKPCPKCHTGIYKLEGCNQMFCTSCHTGFDWRTGAIETNIHNPHYFEWIRRNGGNPQAANEQGQCNGIGHNMFITFNNLMETKHRNPSRINEQKQFIKKVGEIIRNTIHLRHFIPRFRNTNDEEKQRDLRIRYMMNKISESDFKTMVQKNDKNTEKVREIYQVDEILLNTVTDIIVRFLAHLQESEPCKYSTSILDEVNPIVAYVNEQLADISKTYNCVKYHFTDKIELKNSDGYTIFY